MRSGELAERLNVSDSSIRNWSDLYGEFLSPKGKGVQPGAVREFSEADGLVMATVAHLREQAMPHEEIVDTLRSGWRIGELPTLPEPEEEEARREIQLVPVSDVERWRDRAQLAAEQLDQAISRERSALSQIAELQREIGRLEGRSELVDRLEAEIERLRGEVDRLRQERDKARNERRGPFGLW